LGPNPAVKIAAENIIGQMEANIGSKLNKKIVCKIVD